MGNSASKYWASKNLLTYVYSFYLYDVFGPSFPQNTATAEAVSVASVLCHLWGRRSVPGVHDDLVVVVLRRAARVKLEVEVTCSGEGNGLLELVVVSDGMDGLEGPPSGPGTGNLDARELSRASVEETAQLGGTVKQTSTNHEAQ